MKKCSWNIIFRLVDTSVDVLHLFPIQKQKRNQETNQLLENKQQFCPDSVSLINFDKKK